MIDMPEQASKTENNKARSLLVYDTDRVIDESHPLFPEIMIYGKSLEEVHVFTFVKNLKIDDVSVGKIADNIFLYSLPGKGIFLEIDKIWRIIKNQIIWKKRFRADFILNFSTHLGAFIGLYLAKKYKRKFYVFTTGSFVEMPKYSKEYLLQYFLLKGASGVFVTGEKIADALINHGGVSNDKITVARPAVDMSATEQTTTHISYFKIYPQHNFFLITQTTIGKKRDINFILKVFEKIVNRYTRTALIVMVPPEQLEAVRKIVATTKNSSIYVKPIGEDLLSHYAAANIFLSVSDSDETAISIIRALNLNTPVVTTESGIAKEIFQGSKYQEFMKSVGDIVGYTEAVFKLIENQQLRNDYRLNSTLLIKELTLQTLPDHVATILASIEERDKQVI